MTRATHGNASLLDEDLSPATGFELSIGLTAVTRRRDMV